MVYWEIQQNYGCWKNTKLKNIGAQLESQTGFLTTSDAIFEPVSLDNYFKPSYIQNNGQSVEKMIIL